MGKNHRFVNRWLEHIRVLTEDIGPRGSTTQGEREGHAYCEKVLGELGLAPQVDRFLSARSAFQVFIVVGSLMVLAYITFLIGGPVGRAAAIVMAGVAVWSLGREMSFRPNPARVLIEKAESQNVVATLPPSGEHHNDLILMGHVDTLRTPFFFKHRRLVDVWRIYATLTMLTFLLMGAVYIVAFFFDWPWIRVLAGLSAVLAALLVAINIHAESTPYTPGANDNATGAGIVLALAEHFTENPLRHTRIWFVCSGCEEVKHYGAINFFETYGEQFVNPRAIVFEMLGTAGPAWLEQEGVVFPFLTKADPELVALCEQIAADEPHWQASATRVQGGNTEAADALRYGVPAITLIGITDPVVRLGYQGEELYWHRMDDTLDKLKPEVMSRAWGFTLALITRLDAVPRAS
jgi:hypothetical protein